MNLDQIVSEMIALADRLVEYSFPISSISDDAIVAPLKSRKVVIDGYHVTIHFSKSLLDVDNEKRYLETFQIIGQDFTFLPFRLVLKLAIRFLGKEDLCHVVEMIDNRRVYCFLVNRDEDGLIIPPFQEILKDSEYDGIGFHILDPSYVNFF